MKASNAGTTLREEAQSCQWLSFYQRELALYMFAHLDQLTVDFCPDRDLHPIMKGAPPSQAPLNSRALLNW